MKVILKNTSIIVLLFVGASCAAPPRAALPGKYNLDNCLEAVHRFSFYELTDLENIDNQSILLETDRGNYYLLVLREPIAEDSHERIIIADPKESALTPLSTQNIVDRNRDKDKSTSNQAFFNRGTDKVNAFNASGNRSVLSGNPGLSTDFNVAPSDIKRFDFVSGRDMIVFRGKPYIFDKIYKLIDKEQAENVKKYLRGTPRN